MLIPCNCQVCQVPMEIEYEPNDVLSAETCKKFATCDQCMRRLGRFQGRPPQPASDPRQTNLPYKDE